jgi:hypothetical protein
MALVSGNKTITGNHILKHNDQGRSLLLACTTKTFEMFSSDSKPDSCESSSKPHRVHINLSGSLCTQSYRTHILAASDYSLVKEQQSKQTCVTNMRRQKLSSSPASIFFPPEDSKVVFGSVRGGGMLVAIPALSTPRRTQIRGDFFVHFSARFHAEDRNNLLSRNIRKHVGKETPPAKMPTAYSPDRITSPVDWIRQHFKKSVANRNVRPKSSLTAAVQSPQPIRAVGR